MQPLAKRGGWKYGFGDLISKAEGDLTIRGVEFSEVGEVKFSEGTRFLSRATLFFYKHVISVARLLLIIHITIYILK